MKLTSLFRHYALFVELLEDRSVPGYALPDALGADLLGPAVAYPLAGAWASEGDAAFLGVVPQESERERLTRLIAATRAEGLASEPPGGGMTVAPTDSTAPAAVAPIVVRATEGQALLAAAGVAAGPSFAASEQAHLPPTRGPSPTIAPFYSGNYTLTDLQAVPGLPEPYGGLTLLAGDPNTLLIGGDANSGLATAAIYAIGVTRDAQSHITGFVGTARFYADAAYIDGGLAYGPGNVLFYTRWPVNEMGQVRSGGTQTARVDELDQFGIAPSVGALNFVPAGYPGQGQMKLVSWSGGQFYTAAIAPDGRGTYSIHSAKQRTTIGGGPEGFAYVPLGSPQFGGPSMLVSEWSVGLVGAYDVNAAGDPIPQTRRDFIQGLTGAEGAYVDPLTGDFLFSTYFGGERIIVVRGFARP